MKLSNIHKNNFSFFSVSDSFKGTLSVSVTSNSSVQTGMCRQRSRRAREKTSFYRFKFDPTVFHHKPRAKRFLLKRRHLGFAVVPRPFAPARAM